MGCENVKWGFMGIYYIGFSRYYDFYNVKGVNRLIVVIYIWKLVI